MSVSLKICSHRQRSGPRVAGATCCTLHTWQFLLSRRFNQHSLLQCSNTWSVSQPAQLTRKQDLKQVRSQNTFMVHFHANNRIVCLCSLHCSCVLNTMHEFEVGRFLDKDRQKRNVMIWFRQAFSLRLSLEKTVSLCPAACLLYTCCWLLRCGWFLQQLDSPACHCAALTVWV